MIHLLKNLILNHLKEIKNTFKEFGKKKSIFFISDYYEIKLKEYSKNKIKNGITTLNEIEFLKIIQQICKGINHLKENSISHRDLKLDNIMMDNDNHLKKNN